MKSGKQSNIERRYGWKDFPKGILQPSPKLFNGVEVWRIWREEQKLAASVLGSRNRPLLGMEGSIIHYDHGTLFQRKQELC